MEKGTFYITSLSTAKFLPSCDLKIIAVRFLKETPQGWIHIHHLCPSKKLLLSCKEIEKENKWNVDVFNSYYKPNFLKEMNLDKKSKALFLRILKLLDEGKNIAFACFCSDCNKCHRSIIADLVECRGYKVIRQ